MYSSGRLLRQRETSNIRIRAWSSRRSNCYLAAVSTLSREDCKAGALEKDGNGLLPLEVLVMSTKKTKSKKEFKTNRTFCHVMPKNQKSFTQQIIEQVHLTMWLLAVQMKAE